MPGTRWGIIGRRRYSSYPRLGRRLGARLRRPSPSSTVGSPGIDGLVRVTPLDVQAIGIGRLECVTSDTVPAGDRSNSRLSGRWIGSVTPAS